MASINNLFRFHVAPNIDKIIIDPSLNLSIFSVRRSKDRTKTAQAF